MGPNEFWTIEGEYGVSQPFVKILEGENSMRNNCTKVFEFNVSIF